MRRPRLILPEALIEAGAYHVISRVTHRQVLFGDEEKAKLVDLMRRYERFCGVRVLTFCIMGNHFHMLVQVPPRPENADNISDAELVAKVRRCQGKMAALFLEQDLKSLLRAGDLARHAELRNKWLARMWNLAAFVQSVKQRFSVWFNKHTQRRGTLWEERFKSTVVMGPEAIASVAAYIDLNPVRAGLVDDPKDYAYSGYGESVAGGRWANEGLKQALCGQRGGFLPKGAKDYLEWYRRWIYGRGLERGVKAEDGKRKKRGFKQKEVAQVQEEQRGRLPSEEALKKRVRYFSDGLAVGTKELLEEVFESARGYFGPKRKRGPRKMRGKGWGVLKAMRDLRN